MALEYGYFRGKVYIGDRDANGLCKPLTELKEVSELELNLSVERIQNFNTNVAISSKDLDVAHRVDGTARLMVKDWNAFVLALSTFGTKNTETSTADFTATAFPSGIAVGDVVPVPAGWTNLSALTIKDSAGTPATLVSGTDYTVDMETGLVTFLVVSGKTQPFTAEGTRAVGIASVGFLKQRTVEKYLVFDGVNIASEDKKIIMHLYRVTFFTSSLKLKQTGNEPMAEEFEVGVLADPYKTDSGTLGRYGFIRIND